MFRKQGFSLAAIAVIGVLALTGCGASTPSPTSVSEQARVESGDSEAGKKITLVSGTAKANNAPPKTGDWATGADGTPDSADQRVVQQWVQLKAVTADGIGRVVVNGAGMTLYRFDKDAPKSSKYACVGQCAQFFPPVLVTAGSRIFVAGVQRSEVGTVKRDDGTHQVVIGGWPVYRFVKDSKPGDVNGQGLSGTWFAVTPNGQKAGAQDRASAEAPRSKPSPAAASAILFDAKNFADDEPSQGIAGIGCRNVARPSVASSIATPGHLTLWSEKDCRGNSVVIDGDIADLTSAGLDNTVASIFFWPGGRQAS
ncbi:Secreted repeat of unknown function [Amycolatopsis lurida]|uniref:Lipoprotein n=1 Tax=Amycolatopsis lurida NRRL 2430 TaxID=1460371 RepID=A0A2P2FES6_AMYLU|nr:lipoprotein [Amycolatopsis lurida]KFU75210.1 hypothetical protein BB31_42795 [Amycolatopsis lurida NRRL 2430]SEE32401.1 Secreted repeat of unknown function [Amycolatopsis lurida]